MSMIKNIETQDHLGNVFHPHSNTDVIFDKNGVPLQTNLDAINTTLENKSNDDHSHLNASTSASGYMSNSDKDKLDGIEAQANKTTIVNDLTSGGTDKALSAEQGKFLSSNLTRMCENDNYNKDLHTYLLDANGRRCVGTRGATSGALNRPPIQYPNILQWASEKASFCQLASEMNGNALYFQTTSSWGNIVSPWAKIQTVQAYSLQQESEIELLTLEMEAIDNGTI